MTELAIPLHRSEPSSETYRGQAVARLAEWAESARAAHQVALSLCKTSFVPEAFRDKPEETTAAILAGAEVGLTPMAAIRSFDIIQGVAAPRALTLRAIVQSMGHQIIVDESTATRCIVRARRRDTTEWQKVSWTMDRAMQLGLPQRPTKSGKPNQWKTQPQAMLVARATAEAARLVAADAILGIGYAAEEISDGETVAPATELAPTSKGRRMSLPKPAAGAEPNHVDQETSRSENHASNQPNHAPPLPGEDGYDDIAGDSPNHRPAEAGAVKNAGAEPSTPPSGRNLAPAGSAQQENTAPALPGITAPQRARMLAAFRAIGVEDRDERLHISTAVIGHQVESANKLNQQEASKLIDLLERVKTAENPRQALEDILAELAEQGIQETFDAELVEDGE